MMGARWRANRPKAGASSLNAVYGATRLMLGETLTAARSMRSANQIDAPVLEEGRARKSECRFLQQWLAPARAENSHRGAATGRNGLIQFQAHRAICQSPPGPA